MSVVILTTGVPGCGKTYVRCARYLVDDFLMETDGHVYTNFPINIDVVSEYVSSRLSSKSSFLFGRRPRRCSSDDIASRIHIIPDGVLQSWYRENSGPWDYFAGVDLKGAHIAIDEIHNFCSTMKSLDYLKKWDEFLGEIRHRGCTFEGLTQSIVNVPLLIQKRASIRLELIPCEDLRDPWFHILMLDWYNLKASLTGHLHKTVMLVEKRLNGSTFKVNHQRRFLILPDYFRFYRSFSASLTEKADGVSDDRAVLYEYQKRSRLSLLLWFIRRNFWSLISRFVILGVCIWLFFMGGLVSRITGFIDGFSSAATVGINSRTSDSSHFVDYVPVGSSPVVELPESVPVVPDGVSTSPGGAVVVDSVSDYVPVMFYSDTVTLKNRLLIYKGYLFKGGVYDGKTVERVDFVHRSYVLDDSSIIYMP